MRRIVNLGIIGLIIFTIAATLLASTSTDIAYMWSDQRTGGDPIAAIQLVFAIAFGLAVAGLVLMRPGLLLVIPFKPFGFFIAALAIGAFIYYSIPAVLGG